MNTLSLNSPMTSIISCLNPSRLSGLGWMVGGSLVIAAASQISIPFTPVPFTLQTFAVLLVGMMYGWQLGTATILLYLMEGASGLPVFQGFSGGFSVLLGPTSGYLLGFLFITLLSGYLLQRGLAASFITTFLVGCIALFGTLILGAAVLASFIGLKAAIALGFTPFIGIEIAKALVASSIAPHFWQAQKDSPR
jgi:biotin transport system substrate-specific component